MAALPPLTTDTLWEILDGTLSNQTVNQLLWRCLGYRWDSETEQWNLSTVASEWADLYPEPPDFIGSRPATVKLTRSIPKEDKQLLKEQLGFEGYRVDQLTPNRTRRATAVSWLLSYLQRQS
ncbi:DUF1823 family protein [Synechococcales cyanobacterium C]|uniref:DUF1823 family protein n=1 Tax=Petrachloros mirabilis ULC683 TaxID=2781853 RepID=A0A8K1ZWA7_9CYAN|nr:DUF1823 family protein [Petrachloros mirabilis]NCJ06420.1 DUF1823 family protein [Petrachloros mirabilis ULC683]